MTISVEQRVDEHQRTPAWCEQQLNRLLRYSFGQDLSASQLRIGASATSEKYQRMDTESSTSL